MHKNFKYGRKSPPLLGFPNNKEKIIYAEAYKLKRKNLIIYYKKI